MVTFLVYADEDGLGAEYCMLAKDQTPPEPAGSLWNELMGKSEPLSRLSFKPKNAQAGAFALGATACGKGKGKSGKSATMAKAAAGASQKMSMVENMKLKRRRGQSGGGETKQVGG